MSDCVYVGLDSADVGEQQNNTHSVVCYLLSEIASTTLQTLGERLPHFMKVLTRFSEGLNKVFQGPFGYAPPQGQESCKIDLSRNCTASSEHYEMTHGCCCED